MTVRRTGNDPSKTKKLARKTSLWKQGTRKLQQNPLYQVLLAIMVVALGVWFATSGGSPRQPAEPQASPVKFNSPIVTKKEPVSTSDIYDIVDIPGKGKGMVARRDIKQGDLILTDNHILRYEPHPEEDPIEYLWSQMANMTSDQVEEIQSLYYPPATPPRGIPLAVMMTNGYVAGTSMALFPKAARMNHACAGGMNVAYNWRESDGKLHMHALRDINQGEELYTSYIDTKAPRDWRRKLLKDDYHFECTCPVCSLPEDLSTQSDERLSVLQALFEQLPGWNDETIDGKQTIEIINKIWELSVAEDYFNELGEIAAIASMVASAHSDSDATTQWSRLAAKWIGIAFGTDSMQAVMSEQWALDPKSHPAYGKKDAMVVGGPNAVALKSLE